MHLIPLWVLRRIHPDQAYYWTKEWQKAEQRATQDILADRVKRFHSVTELIEHLNGNNDRTED